MNLDHFEFAHFTVKFAAEQPIHWMQHPGAILRGAFGRVLKTIYCRRPDDQCSRCFLSKDCTYWTCFARRGERGGREPVRPYIIEPAALYGQSLEPGEEFAFGLTFFGSHIDMYRDLWAICLEMGRGGFGWRRGRATPLGIYSMGREDYREIFEAGSAPTILNPLFVHTGNAFRAEDPEPAQRIRIALLFPTRIKHEGQLQGKHIPFHVLLSRLLERILDLDKEYFENRSNAGAEELKAWVHKAQEEVELVFQNTEWVDWERYSTHQKQRMKLGGLVGELVYEGNLSPFMPFLRLGEYVHLGGKSTFGNGLIRVEVLG